MEYKQERYRATEGRFDGSLNRMAANGWTVVSIDRFDDIYLVTFSRPKPMQRHAEEVSSDQLAKLLQKMWKAGWKLEHLVPAGKGEAVDKTPELFFRNGVDEVSEMSVPYYLTVWSRTPR